MWPVKKQSNVLKTVNLRGRNNVVTQGNSLIQMEIAKNIIKDIVCDFLLDKFDKNIYIICTTFLYLRTCTVFPIVSKCHTVYESNHYSLLIKFLHLKYRTFSP